MVVVITLWVSQSRSFLPEIDIDKIPRISGMNITFVTTANTDEESLELLKLLGLPFQTNNNG